ncbi:MAG TPA: Gfo/Idh/MocA family oxidoreductase [Bryobacteraceae bacterium]|nr:Gfo/Idh/MocA family oxidoreductase [Bryobacteraceae bacterium]
MESPDQATRRGFLGSLGATAVLARQRSAAPVRVGVVGGGFGSSFQWHLHPNAKVAAVCDIRPDRLQRLSEVYRCGTTLKSFRELLKQPELDAIAVFTPAPLHVWMATEAMKAGKHVISAVPAGISIEECERLLECVKSTGMKYMMAETSYYRPEIMTCVEWAREGRFGTIFYSEAEYHHEGLLPLMYDDRGFPTWRYGFPPMLYPTHSVGMIVPVTGERLAEVQAVGWGDGHEILQTNQYKNPFWNTTGFFKTSGGHSSRVSVFWHVAAGGTERAQFYGSRLSYIMERPEGSPNTVIRIARDGKTVIDANGYPEGDVAIEAFKQPDHFEKLPAPLRVKTGHGNSHTFITHEFVSAILEDRQPAVNAWEAIAYTVPGIVAHQSALRGGEPMKIKDYGKPPA